MSLIQVYLERTKSYSASRFVLEMSFWLICSSFLDAMALARLSPAQLYGAWQNSTIFNHDLILLLVSRVLGGLLATLWSQFIPYYLIRLFTKQDIPYIFTSMVFYLVSIFALGKSYWLALFSLPDAFVYAWSYLVWSQKPRGFPFLITASIYFNYSVFRMLYNSLLWIR